MWSSYLLLLFHKVCLLTYFDFFLKPDTLPRRTFNCLYDRRLKVAGRHM